MRRAHYLTIATAAALGLLAGCGGSAKQQEAEPAPAADTAANADPVQAQIARGQAAYGKYCSKCHGASGEGTADAPPVVGEGALPLDPRPEQKFRTGQFKTAMDVAQFAVENMPPKGAKPEASLYWDILAFDLHANGVKLTEPVGPDNAASIVLHP